MPVLQVDSGLYLRGWKATSNVLLTMLNSRPQHSHFVDQSKGCYELGMCLEMLFVSVGDFFGNQGAITNSGLDLGISLPDGVGRHHNFAEYVRTVFVDTTTRPALPLAVVGMKRYRP